MTHFHPHYMQNGFKWTFAVSEHLKVENCWSTLLSAPFWIGLEGEKWRCSHFALWSCVQKGWGQVNSRVTGYKVWIIFPQSRRHRKRQMDAPALQMLRWLSVRGNSWPPCSRNKMLEDLKQFRSSQSVCARQHRQYWLIIPTCPCQTSIVPLMWQPHGSTSLCLELNACAAKRVQKADTQASRKKKEKKDELPYSQVTPLDDHH